MILLYDFVLSQPGLFQYLTGYTFTYFTRAMIRKCDLYALFIRMRQYFMTSFSHSINNPPFPG